MAAPRHRVRLSLRPPRPRPALPLGASEPIAQARPGKRGGGGAGVAEPSQGCRGAHVLWRLRPVRESVGLRTISPAPAGPASRAAGRRGGWGRRERWRRRAASEGWYPNQIFTRRALPRDRVHLRRVNGTQPVGRLRVGRGEAWACAGPGAPRAVDGPPCVRRQRRSHSAPFKGELDEDRNEDAEAPPLALQTWIKGDRPRTAAAAEGRSEIMAAQPVGRGGSSRALRLGQI
eukprot:scaffold2043_cov375-Prasinococcus_capsulatus_cf.AAC.7